MSRWENLKRPPRNVPWSVAVKALFGGAIQQIGWLLLAVGMAAFIGMIVSSGLSGALLKHVQFQGEVQKVDGVIVAARGTNTSINEREVVHYTYEYEAGGDVLVGDSYKTGWLHDEGERVTVEVLADNPFLSRLEGGRWMTVTWWVLLFLLIFPSIGIALAFHGFKKGVKGLKLLKSGRLAQATLVSKEPTNTSINEQTVYEYTFKFTAESTGREHLATARSHTQTELEDEETEGVLYLPSYPDDSVLVDELPGSPEIDGRGKFLPGGLGSALKVLILPAVATVALLYLVFDFWQAVNSL